MLDAGPTAYQRAGVARYAGELLAALGRQAGRDEFIGFVPPRVGPRTWRAAIAWSHVTRMPLDAAVPRCDVFHATDFVAPLLRRSATVVSVHDLTFALLPSYHRRLNRTYLSSVLPRVLARAAAVVVPSEATRNDLGRFVDISPEKVFVVHYGVGAGFAPAPAHAVERVRNAHRLPSRYILFVGTFEPRKDVSTLLTAYARLLLASGSGVPALVLAGPAGWGPDDVSALIGDLRLGSKVHRLGWISDRDLPALMTGAEVFAYPSLYEGFGFPPLEAMACGTPVIASAAGALPEVVGAGGLLVSPGDADRWAEALERVLLDPELCQQLRREGLERAGELSWSRSATRLVEVYRLAARVAG